MAVGIRVSNPSGVVQIDETYRNFLRVGSGSYSGGGGTISISYTSQSVPPIIFVRPHSDGIYLGKFTIRNSTAQVFTNGGFDWVVYSLTSPQAISNSPMGIQVFDAAGQVIFDSRFEPPRIQTTLAVNQQWPTYLQGGSLGQYPAYPYSINFSGWGARPWFCLNSLYFFADENGQALAMTTNGTNQLILRCGTLLGTSWSWSSNDGSNGVYAYSHPFGQFRCPIVKR